MPRRPDSRPENALTLALVLDGAALLTAVVLIVLSVVREDHPTQLIPWAIALVVAAGALSAVILVRARRIRRRERPEWLETQAWQQGLHEQIEKGKPARGPDRPER